MIRVPIPHSSFAPSSAADPAAKPLGARDDFDTLTSGELVSLYFARR